jgi:4-hydroxybenzoyl-CoA reductase subunit beta
MEYPSTVNEALALLAEYGERAMILAGGTDLLPNMKHGLFEPELVIGLGSLEDLKGICQDDDGSLHLGAMTTLSEIAQSETVAKHAPALAQAVSSVAGPQLRNMGTIGGNVMLDTRCQWYNQTHFWRKSLGYCLKKDGTVCHVIEGGKKCVAAASNDSAPALMTLGAELSFLSASGESTLPIQDLWKADGTWNKKVGRDALLVSIRIPQQAMSHRGSYLKLRERDAIDFPQLGFAVRMDYAEDGSISDVAVAATALGPRPVLVSSAPKYLVGMKPGNSEFDSALESLCAKAHQQLSPLPNIPGDESYRKRMIPVYLKRALLFTTQR